MTTLKAPQHRAWRDCGLIILFMVLAYMITLGFPTLFPPDEGRYAEIPREMLLSGHWLVPHLNGVIYFEKPPLIYWLTALVMKLFGDSIWAVRLINPILSTLGCLFIYVVGRSVFNCRTGFLAAIMTGSALLYLGLGRLLTLDVGVSFFLTVSLGSFLVSHNRNRGLSRTLWLWLAYFAAGCAIMTKGLIGIVFPIMIIGVWILIYHYWAYLKHMRIITGVVIVLLVNVPWVLAVQHQYSFFVHQYFWVQQFARYATPIASRHMNFFAYVGVLLAGLLPWLVFLPQSIKQVLTVGWARRHQRHYEGFLLLWGGLIFLFFAPSQSKLITYLLPVVAPLCLLMARWLDQCWDQLCQSRFCASVWVFILVCVLMVIAGVVVPQLPNMTDHPALVWYLGALSLWMIVVVIGTVIALRYQQIKTILLWMVLSFTVAGNLIWMAMPMMNNRSVAAIATTINHYLVHYPKATVATLSNYYQDLPFYVKRRIVVADWQGELSVGIEHQPSSHQWMISKAQLLQLWQQPHIIFLVLSNEAYHNDFVAAHRFAYRIMHNDRVSLITNRPVTPITKPVRYLCHKTPLMKL